MIENGQGVKNHLTSLRSGDLFGVDSIEWSETVHILFALSLSKGEWFYFED
jgi:hypothetical protein